MKDAAYKARILKRRPIGKTTLILVEEPEAAPLCTLFDRRNYPEIGIGETFIVCDCGGGTVDIISYTVESQEPFRIAEAVCGAGKLCGAFLVDQAFEDYMIRKSGLKFDKCEANDFRSFVNDEWEFSMKRSFEGEEQQSSFVVRPPARTFGTVKRVRGENDNFRLAKDVIKQFFAKTYSGVHKLISQQMEQIMMTKGKVPKKVLLVGGLGASPYLYSLLNKKYRNVLQPRKAWSAVARGAVIKVLKSAYDPEGSDPGTAARFLAYPSLISRVARFRYGIQLDSLTATVSPPADRERDIFSIDSLGVECVTRLYWYIHQNERVECDREPIVYVFFKWLASKHDMKDDLPIFISDAKTPPIRRDASIKELCVIRYKVGVPWEELRQVEDSKGRMYRNANGIKLSMNFDGEPKWALRSGDKLVEQDVNVEYIGA